MTDHGQGQEEIQTHATWGHRCLAGRWRCVDTGWSRCERPVDLRQAIGLILSGVCLLGDHGLGETVDARLLAQEKRFIGPEHVLHRHGFAEFSEIAHLSKAEIEKQVMAVEVLSKQRASVSQSCCVQQYLCTSFPFLPRTR